MVYKRIASLASRKFRVCSPPSPLGLSRAARDEIEQVKGSLQQRWSIPALILPAFGYELQYVWRGLCQKAAGSTLKSAAGWIGIPLEDDISTWLMC